MNKIFLTLTFVTVNLFFANTESLVKDWQKAECEERCEAKAFCRPGASNYNQCMKTVNECKARCR